MNPIMKYVEDSLKQERKFPKFRPGDNISVSYKIVEGSKERIQIFRGDVIQINGESLGKTFTVRKMSNGVGVERIFPMESPNIVEIKVNKFGSVRRAKLFYQRERVGKRARIKERRFIKKDK